MRAGTDIDAKVNTAEERYLPGYPVYIISIQNRCSRITAASVILRIGRIPLYDQLQNAVRINIAQRHIVCHIGCNRSVRHCLVGRSVQGKLYILVIPCLCFNCLKSAVYAAVI